MKNLIILFAILLTSNCFSQDLIILKNETYVEAEVIDIKEGVVAYILSKNPKGPNRYINTEDIKEIIYEDGYREIFKVEEKIPEHKISQEKEAEEKTETLPSNKKITAPSAYPKKIETNRSSVQEKQIVSPTSSSPYYQQEKIIYEKPKRYGEGEGWIFGGMLKLVLPYGEDASERYGYYSGISFNPAYFGRGFGIECEYFFLRNPNGKVEGYADATADMKFSVFTLSGYWAPQNPHTKNTFFLGGGFGSGIMSEYIEDSGYSEELELSVSEGHISVGFLIKHFRVQLTSSAILAQGYEANFGGLHISIGGYF